MRPKRPKNLRTSIVATSDASESSPKDIRFNQNHEPGLL